MELDGLSPADKKVFVEGLIPGKIEIVKREYEAQAWSIRFGLVFDRAIFERLASEGKSNGLFSNGQDSSHSAAASQPAG